VNWSQDNYSEYNKVSQEVDYADPKYYQKESPTRKLYNLEPTPLEFTTAPAHTGFAEYVHPEMAEDHNLTMPVSEYRGPASLQEFTADAGFGDGQQADARMQVQVQKEQSQASGSRKRKRLAGVGGIASAIGALLLKFPALGFLFKFGWAGVTALISVVVYSYIFGWKFAVGLVALLFVHEMGHAVVMKIKGIPVGGMIFIPMLGAAVFMRQMPKNAKDEAEVGIAGPIAGALAASVCLWLAIQNQGASNIWAPLAYFGFFMNLFNLFPILPFDGGRVLAAIDRRIWIIGLIGLVAFQIWSWMQGNFSLWLLFFIFIAGSQLWARNSGAKSAESKAYYTVPLTERIILTLVYFGLAAVLVLGMTISHNMMFPSG
jgi:Zn-dependent protease